MPRFLQNYYESPAYQREKQLSDVAKATGAARGIIGELAQWSLGEKKQAFDIKQFEAAVASEKQKQLFEVKNKAASYFNETFDSVIGANKDYYAKNPEAIKDVLHYAGARTKSIYGDVLGDMDNDLKDFTISKIAGSWDWNEIGKVRDIIEKSGYSKASYASANENTPLYSVMMGRNIPWEEFLPPGEGKPETGDLTDYQKTNLKKSIWAGTGKIITESGTIDMGNLLGGDVSLQQYIENTSPNDSERIAKIQRVIKEVGDMVPTKNKSEFVNYFVGNAKRYLKEFNLEGTVKEIEVPAGFLDYVKESQPFLSGNRRKLQADIENFKKQVQIGKMTVGEAEEAIKKKWPKVTFKTASGSTATQALANKYGF